MGETAKESGCMIVETIIKNIGSYFAAKTFFGSNPIDIQGLNVIT